MLLVGCGASIVVCDARQPSAPLYTIPVATFLATGAAAVETLIVSLRLPLTPTGPVANVTCYTDKVAHTQPRIARPAEITRRALHTSNAHPADAAPLTLTIPCPSLNSNPTPEGLRVPRQRARPLRRIARVFLE